MNCTGLQPSSIYHPWEHISHLEDKFRPNKAHWTYARNIYIFNIVHLYMLASKVKLAKDVRIPMEHESGETFSKQSTTWLRHQARAYIPNLVGGLFGSSSGLNRMLKTLVWSLIILYLACRTVIIWNTMLGKRSELHKSTTIEAVITTQYHSWKFLLKTTASVVINNK
jgi:hypothetical protein